MHHGNHTTSAPAESAAPCNSSGVSGEHSANSSADITVAVVGSGPSGCYVAQFLTKRWPRAEITIFEAMPTPYGLVRYGVAADHQGAKAVTRQFDRLFTRNGVRFAGNVAVGRDVPFEVLVDAFDVVVVATGLPVDRTLDIPQHDHCRVIGAGALLRALNGFPSRHPLRDDTGCIAPLGPRLAVIGMGNVAMDVIRLLAKEDNAFSGSDIDDELRVRLRPRAALTFDVLSRSPAAEAKFDLAMLRELIALPNLDVCTTGIPLADQSDVATLLRTFADVDLIPSPTTDSHRNRLNLHFGLTPQRIEPDNDGTVLHAWRRMLGEAIAIPVDTIITAIGFTHARTGEAAHAPLEWAGRNVYRVGWFSRGATGTIPENRKDAQRVVESIIDDTSNGRLSLGKPGFRAVAPLVAERMISFSGWQRIEAFERQTAPSDRCRQKIVDIEQMIAVATKPELLATPSSPR